MERSEIKQQKENRRQRKYKDDLNTYLEFIKLFRKKRPLAYQQKVLKIIAEEESLIARINIIKDLDREWNNKENGDTDIYNIPNRREKKEEAVAKSKKIEKLSFFTYLFGDRTAIMRFGKRTKTIDFSFFGIIKKLSPESISYLQELIKDCQKTLIDPVNNIVTQGWKSLDAYEYNAINALNTFIKTLIFESNNILQSSKVYTSLANLITPYLCLIHKKETIDVIKNTIFDYFKNNENYSADIHQIISIIEEILSDSKLKITFMNIIIAYMMISYNRFIKSSLLFENSNFIMIEKENYNFSDEVKEIVEKYMEELKAESMEAEIQISFLQYIDESFSFNSAGKENTVTLFDRILLFNDYPTLKHISYSKQKSGFSNDMPLSSISLHSKNIGKLIYNFCFGFIEIYSDFFIYGIKLDGDHTNIENSELTKIFNEKIFQDDLFILTNYIKEYEFYHHSASDSYNLDVQDYSEFTNTRRAKSGISDKLCLLIETTLKAINRIQFHLSTIIANNKKLTETISSNSHTLEITPIQTIQDSIEKRIPFFQIKISSRNKYHPSRTIEQVLNEILVLLANISFLMMDDDILRAVERKPKLIESIEQYLHFKDKFF